MVDSNLTEDELRLFQQNMSSVTPLKQQYRSYREDGISPSKTNHKKQIRPLVQINQLDFSTLDTIDTPDITTDYVSQKAESTFYRFHVYRKQIKQLKQGGKIIQDTLDLHGLYQKDALEALQVFLSHCHDQQLSYVQIIHGKGNRSKDNIPVLKRLTLNWLQSQKSVTAYCPASISEGGSGATNVLIKAARIIKRNNQATL